MTVFADLLYAEFLSTLHYSPQDKKYTTLCDLISTLYTLIFRTFNKYIFFLMAVQT